MATPGIWQGCFDVRNRYLSCESMPTAASPSRRTAHRGTQRCPGKSVLRPPVQDPPSLGRDEQMRAERARTIATPIRACLWIRVGFMPCRESAKARPQKSLPDSRKRPLLRSAKSTSPSGWADGDSRGIGFSATRFLVASAQKQRALEGHRQPPGLRISSRANVLVLTNSLVVTNIMRMLQIAPLDIVMRSLADPTRRAVFERIARSDETHGG